MAVPQPFRGKIYDNITELIGNTPMVRLRKVTSGGAEVVVKKNTKFTKAAIKKLKEAKIDRLQVDVEEIAGGEVHRDRHRPAEALQRGGFVEGEVKDGAGQGGHQAGALGQREEGVGCDPAAARVGPAHECFRPDHSGRRGGDDRLELDAQAASVQGLAERFNRCQAVPGVAVARVVVNL